MQSYLNFEGYYSIGSRSDFMGDNLKVCSLFSGCGGLDLGFDGGFEFLGKKYPKNKFEIVFANDIEPKACETFEKNFGVTPHCGDIREILKYETNKIPDCDVVTGGFPCQDFSMAGKRRGFNSERGLLYKSMKRVIELKKPKFFLAENVKGLMNLGGALETIKSDFASLPTPYIVTHNLFNAAYYGVPQRRERVLIFGVRDDIYAKQGDYKWPNPHLSQNNWVTSKKALDDLLTINKSLSHQNEYSKARNYGAHAQGNKAIKGSLPSVTIRAEHHGNIEFHYSERRRLTVRECARIQSFPDSFDFVGAASNIYKQIGNAVPPVLAWHVARSIQDYLNGKQKKGSSECEQKKETLKLRQG